jgi:RHS repeat-associated protein
VWRGRLPFVLSILLVASIVSGTQLVRPARVAAAPPGAPALTPPTRVSVPAQPAAKRPSMPPAEASAAPAAAPVWPTAVDVSADLSSMVAGSLTQGVTAAKTAPVGDVVSVGPPAATALGKTAAPAPAAVDVHVLDAAAVAPAGGIAVGVRLSRTDGVSVSAPVAVSVDYSKFGHAYGGDFAGRLQLVQAPACALTTPDVAGCDTRTVLDAVNDRAAQTITATADAAPDLATVGTQALTDATGDVVMLTAGASSTSGDFRATGLAPTGAWSVSAGSGDFTYSVPVTVPPPPVGSAPPISLGYDSQSVDGLTSAQNTQANPAGLGWSLSGSYIERHYRLCSDDGAAATVGDLCWDSPNTTPGVDPANADYTIVLNGESSELVKDPSKANFFHLVDDPGWSVQHLTGASNADNDGEFWLVTDGHENRYYFGIGKRVTDNAATNSVQTAPVWGNNTGEPTCGTSPCVQAYRWNLDREIDANLVDSAWMYAQDTNNYYSTMGTAAERSYVRDSHVTEVDYGMADGIIPSKFADKVTFNFQGRCTDNMSDLDPLHSGITPLCPSGIGSPTHYPDVPTDLECSAGDANKCATHTNSPVFFTTWMLWSITTWAIPDGVTPMKVMTYQLRHHFHTPATGDVENVLWLDIIQREGFPYAGPGTGLGVAITLPTIAVYGTDFNNALSTSVDLEYLRITTIDTDLGAAVTIGYGHPTPCHIATPPDPANNGQDCFKQEWTPPGGSQTWGWFNKLLVTSVTVDPGVGFAGSHDGDPVQTTTYTYLPGKAGWRFPADPTRKREDESWTEWRGYPKMTTTTGSGANAHSTVNYVYQGIDGDRKVIAPTGPGDYKSGVVITDSNGVGHADSNYLAGKALEDVGRDNAGAGQSEVFHDYWSDDIAVYDGTPDARFVRETTTTSFTKLSTSITSDSTWRKHVVTTGFDASKQASDQFGLPVYVLDQGNSVTTADDTCTAYGYAFNTDVFTNSTQQRFMALPDDVTHYLDASCPTTAGQDGHVVTLYDGAATVGVNKPTHGDPTETDTSTSATTVAIVKNTYDGAGRVLTTTDPDSNTTTNVYSPATNWPTSGVTTTTAAPDPLGVTGSATGLVTATVSTPAFGLPISTTDPNGHVTGTQYDSVGRLIKAWRPSEPTNGPASFTFAYTIPTGTVSSVPTMVTGPAKTTTSTLQDLTPTYLSTYSYIDGLGRTRETQADNPTDEGGQLVTTTRYDTAGNVAGTTGQAFFNFNDPGTGMVNPTIASLPSYNQADADWAGRTTQSSLLANGVASGRGRISAVYAGADKTTSTDPDLHVTDTYTDVFGQTTSQVQQTPNLTPTTITTSYAYNDTGQLARITDAAGHVTSYGYDWAGRRTSGADPDTGTTTSTYDAAGNQLTATDQQGQKITTVYDHLNRPTASWLGNAGTGTQLTALSYDTKAGGRGQVTKSISYQSGNAYTSTVDGYDVDGRPTGTTITIPAAEGVLAGSYDTTTGYDTAGRPATIGYPAVGSTGVSLPAETVTTSYGYGLPSQVSSPLATYSSVGYMDYDGRPFLREWGLGGSYASRSFNWDDLTGALNNLTTTYGTVSTRTTLQNDTYAYDNAGNVTEIAAATTGQQQCFSYDNLNRLVSAYTSTDAVTTCFLSHPAHIGNGTYDLDYTYDQLGDITTTIDNISGITSTYTETDAAHIHATTNVTRSGGATGTDTYSYNADGNLTGRTVAGTSSTLAWTPRQQLASITSGTSTTSYIYDAGGNLLIRKAPTGSTLYLPGEELNTSGSTVTPTRYYTCGGTAVAQRVGGNGTTGTLTWLANDSQASAQLAINPDTGAGTEQRYLPFGAQRGTGGPPAGSQRAFLGQVFDPGVGLLQDGARFYDPTLARFINPDPLLTPSNPQTLNAYSYANNNPTTYSDPTGLEPGSWCTASSSSDCGAGQYDAGNQGGGGGSGGSGGGGGGSGGGSPPPKTVTVPFIPDEHKLIANDPAYALGQHSKFEAFSHYYNNWCANISEGGGATSQQLSDCSSMSSFFGWHGPSLADLALVFIVPGAIGAAAVCAATIEVCLPLASAVASGAAPETAGIDITIAGYGGARVVGGAWGAGRIVGKLAEDGGEDGSLLGRLCVNSFTPDTPVLMADHTTKPIKDIKVGDKVIATDPTTGETTTETVTQLHDNQDTDLTDLTITADGHTNIIHTTTQHPFWDATTRNWTVAGRLGIGDHLLTDNASIAIVAGIRSWNAQHEMRNLTVETLHTYYVIAGTTPVLVHNEGLGGCGIPTPLGLGSTGRTVPNDLKEQLAMEQAMSNPAAGRQINVPMTDPLWPANEGWVKMAQNVNGVEIHYVMNTIGEVDDFKFK